MMGGVEMGRGYHNTRRKQAFAIAAKEEARGIVKSASSAAALSVFPQHLRLNATFFDDSATIKRTPAVTGHSEGLVTAGI